MNQQDIVGMIDEEIARLYEVRQILESLLPGEHRIAPMLEAVEDGTVAAGAEANVAAAAPVRHTSRRGIATGRRGPRRVAEPVAPRPLDGSVPHAPVVVSKAALLAAREPKPDSPAVEEATLEAWARSIRPGTQASTA